MQRSRRTLPLMLLSTLLASCATIERDEVAAPAEGGTVAMRVGTPLVVSLPPDPDAGYGWVVRSATPNLQLVGGPDYTPQPKPWGLVGVPDTTVFRFRATETGTGSIVFAWSVPPGMPPQPERVVRYDVTIGPNLWAGTDYLGTIGLDYMRTPGRFGNPPADAAASSASPGAVR
jgi:inhibitor of cysteine peptidase